MRSRGKGGPGKFGWRLLKGRSFQLKGKITQCNVQPRDYKEYCTVYLKVTEIIVLKRSQCDSIKICLCEVINAVTKLIVIVIVYIYINHCCTGKIFACHASVNPEKYNELYMFISYMFIVENGKIKYLIDKYQFLKYTSVSFNLVQFSRSVLSDCWPHEQQHARSPCPSPTPRIYPNPCPLSRWCHPTVSPSVIPFSSCLQSFPASGSFQMSQLFASGGQSIGILASASVLPMNTQDWSPLGWTGWISLQSKGLSRVFSNTTVQKHQFFGAQLSSQSNSHIHTWLLEKP